MSKIENEIKKENMREDILEEFDSNLTDKDLHKILNHVAFWLYKNIKSKYTDEFVKVDNVALLRSIKDLKNGIVHKKFDKYIKNRPDWWHGDSD